MRTSTGLCWNLNLHECLSVETLLLKSSDEGIPYDLRRLRPLLGVPTSSGTFHPLICDNLKSSTLTSNGNSGIHTVNFASPVYVPYFTITEALDEPLISDPSTYTELHDEDT